jgi:acyl-ACP thioesterase
MNAPRLIHEEEFRIRVYHTGGGGPRATLPALFDLLQETAGMHAAALHVSAPDLLERGFAWVLSRLCLRAERFPALGERIRLRTWPHARDQYATRRDFLIFGQDGSEIMRAASAWVVLDLSTRKLAALPGFLDGLWDTTPAPALEFPSKTVPRLKPQDAGEPILVRRADLDINGHVNNARFPEWCLESLPPEAADLSLVQADIAFRAECLLGDAVASHTAPAEDGFLHCLTKGEGGEFCRMRTWWGPAARP